MPRRVFAGAVALALLVPGYLAGGPASAGEDVELTFAMWHQDQVPVMEEIAEAFAAANPGISVTIQQTPWEQYWTKLQTAAGGGEAADVFWMNGPNVQLYASEGVILPLSDMIEADSFDTSVYPQALVDMYTFDESVYALPKDFDTVGLWYNRDLFDAAGVGYPDETWTWDTFREAARTLTDADAGVWGVAARLAGQEGYYNTIPQAGGFVISPDGTSSGYAAPEAAEGISFWVDLIEEGVSPTHSQMVDTDPRDMFQAGRVAMIWDGSWNTGLYSSSALADSVDVAPLPQGPAGSISVIHGVGMAIWANTDHPEQAWEWVKFLMSEEAALIQAEHGVTMPSYEGTQAAWVEANPQFNLQVFVDEVEGSVAYPVSLNTAAWIQDEEEILGLVWAGELSVEEGLQQLGEAMQAKLDDER